MPFELMAYAINNENKINLRFFKMLKMIRLLRLSRIINYLKTNQKVKFGLHMF